MKVTKLASWRQFLALAIVAMVAAAPVACSDMAGSPSDPRVDCHKTRGHLEC